MRSVYPWMGGKFFELKWIMPLIPPLKYYYEPFFGSGVILLNIPKEVKGEEEFANDINSKLVSFWLCLQKESLMEELKEKCLKALDSRFIYKLEMKKWEDPRDLSLVDQAFNFLYLVKFGFNSYPNTYYTPLTHKMYKIKNFSRTFRLMARQLPKYYDRIKDIRFTNLDFAEFLEKNEPAEGKFIFLDPPYYKTHQYHKDYGIEGEFKVEDYLKMNELLTWHTDGGTKWMITCNQINTFFDDMKDIRIKLVDRRACINKNEERVDVKTKIVMNYDIKETGCILDMINNEEQGDPLLV